MTTPGFQDFTVPATGTYRFTLNGAEGGESRAEATAGLGGRVVGDLDLTQGQIITLVIGQAGEGFDDGGSGSNYFVTGGFNGGGGTGYQTNGGLLCGNCSHASGGGGTDVRIGGTDLADRIIVAGGGGGGSTETGGTGPRDGGAGGGLIGGDGQGNGNSDTSNDRGHGGTQSAGGLGGDGHSTIQGLPGTLGQGGRGSRNDASGGGGGYYGGGGGGNNASGGGGSSYTDPSVLNVTHSQGVNSGDGSVTIELLP